MTRLEEIAARKQRLVTESDNARNEMVRVYYQYQARTIMARKITALLKNPAVLVALGLIVLKMPWRRVARLGGWTWRGWRLFRMIRHFAP